MAQFVVRNIEDAVKVQLQRRARRNGRSMEEEIRDILRNATVKEPAPTGGLGNEIAGLFTKVGLEADIPELRGHMVKPFDFES
ncbi:MAG: Arc family DNA-binding protein [Terriglobales bacterium]